MSSAAIAQFANLPYERASLSQIVADAELLKEACTNI